MAKPDWLTIKPASTEKYHEIKDTVRELGLHTVCTEAHCPNITECWSGGTATFMVLGDKCTRGCRFCAVQKMAHGVNVDKQEPEKLGQVIGKWGLDYVVITSVCRDDLEDQGAEHFARCVEEIKKQSPGTIVELLIPDFRGELDCLERVVSAKPDVVGHNLETVERLSPQIRDRRAAYKQSLEVLLKIKKFDPGIYTKSAMMLGIGESDEEVLTAMRDLRLMNVDFLALGQYLRPSQHHLELEEYVHPDKFREFEKRGMEMGFKYVAAGPFVRSSYRAGEFFIKAAISRDKAIS